MKLFYSNTSPYSRKVLLVIVEKSLAERVEKVLVNPFQKNAELNRANPLGKIPALVLDNGETLFDSPVICHYLDSLASNKSMLIPAHSKWSVLRWEALTDGLMDAIYNLVMETRRPIQEQSQSWINRWTEDIKLILAYIENEIDQLGTEITLVHLGLGASLGYLEFRLPHLLYELTNPHVSRTPKLFDWYERFKTHTSMRETLLHD